MHTSIQLAAILSILLQSSAIVLLPADKAALGVRSAVEDPAVRVPLNIHDSRQYSDDLAVKQDWLKSQAAGLRSKYASHLGENGKRLVQRDQLAKRASGSAT
jgi:hypothetical protein